MWLFRHKYNADGTLSRYKARLVANGSTQLAGCIHAPTSGFFGSAASRIMFAFSKDSLWLKKDPRAWVSEISRFAVGGLSLDCMTPRAYLSALRGFLGYWSGSVSYGLQLYSSTTSSLVAYSDADWAGCPTTRRSTWQQSSLLVIEASIYSLSI
ncbi:ribonuclease H-like domain-containing protein [Tanacetum coccineum]